MFLFYVNCILNFIIKGSVSSAPISALSTQDQSGTQDSWSNYVEFYGTKGSVGWYKGCKRG
jgi:hypothetical protein